MKTFKVPQSDFTVSSVVLGLMRISKLSDAETEATETQVWCEMAYLCEYIDKETNKTGSA